MSELELAADQIPDIAESLLGFRVWRVEERTMSLWSVTRGDLKKGPRTRRLITNVLANPNGVWPPGEPFEATCEYRDAVKDHGDDIPAVGCGCGIYATYDLRILAHYIRDAQVLGLVQGSGRFIAGEPDVTTLGGFRAQRATIACLFAISEDFTIPRHRLQKLADRYRVPLVRPHSDTAEDYRPHVRSGWSA
jgi:hypothetical protein